MHGSDAVYVIAGILLAQSAPAAEAVPESGLSATDIFGIFATITGLLLSAAGVYLGFFYWDKNRQEKRDARHLRVVVEVLPMSNQPTIEDFVQGVIDGPDPAETRDHILLCRLRHRGSETVPADDFTTPVGLRLPGSAEATETYAAWGAESGRVGDETGVDLVRTGEETELRLAPVDLDPGATIFFAARVRFPGGTRLITAPQRQLRGAVTDGGAVHWELDEPEPDDDRFLGAPRGLLILLMILGFVACFIMAMLFT